jgi:hypothetical protein
VADVDSYQIVPVNWLVIYEYELIAKVKMLHFTAVGGRP